MSGHVALVLGGARSGKSAWAERLAGESGRPVFYVATATAGDAEMAARIARHRAERPPAWRTLEEPLDLSRAIHAARPGETVLVDCLTLWVSNALFARVEPGQDADALPGAAWATLEAAVVDETRAFLQEARERALTLILVSNEVGMGVVPATPLGRRYQDVLGRVNQTAAADADAVALMIAGIPVDLRGLALAVGDRSPNL